ncbi:hypothetical protein FBU59_001976, partial [Linderina macrospora]
MRSLLVDIRILASLDSSSGNGQQSHGCFVVSEQLRQQHKQRDALEAYHMQDTVFLVERYGGLGSVDAQKVVLAGIEALGSATQIAAGRQNIVEHVDQLAAHSQHLGTAQAVRDDRQDGISHDRTVVAGRFGRGTQDLADLLRVLDLVSRQLDAGFLQDIVQRRGILLHGTGLVSSWWHRDHGVDGLESAQRGAHNFFVGSHKHLLADL